MQARQVGGEERQHKAGGDGSGVSDPGDLPIDVTISIGMAFSMAPETSLQLSSGWGEKMLARADRALYAAKGGGRNQVNQGRPAA